MRSVVPRGPAKGTGWATRCSQVGLLEPVLPAGDACRDAVLACDQSVKKALESKPGRIKVAAPRAPC